MQRTRSLSGRALRPEQLFGDRYGQRSDRSPKSFGNADEPRHRHFGCVEKTSAILLLKQNRLKGCTASLSLFALLHLWTLYPFASPPASLYLSITLPSTSLPSAFKRPSIHTMLVNFHAATPMELRREAARLPDRNPFARGACENMWTNVKYRRHLGSAN